MCISDQTSTSSSTVLIENVSEFGIESFGEDRSYFRIATVNNQIDPVPYSQISSVRFRIKVNIGNKTIERFQLVHLFNNPIDIAGSVTYTFDNTDEMSFSHTNILHDTLTSSDGAVISTSSYSVKIANTGQYFSSIQSAINAATSGNEIWVSEGTYEECITLKSGIKLLGGFERNNWKRDIDTYETTIKTRIGIGDITVTLADQTTLEGFSIDGQNLSYGIYGDGIDRIVVKNCRIDHCEIPFYLNTVTGSVQNNLVTGNSSCMIWNTSSLAKIYRNIFYTKNYFSKANLQFKNDQGFDFRNNVVLQGSKGIEVDQSSINIINNIIARTSNMAIWGNASVDTHIRCYNNIIIKNNLGVFCPVSAIFVDWNYFNANRFGNTGASYPPLLPNNQIDNATYDWDTIGSNPIFNIVTYELEDGSPFCIDKGYNNSAYDDIYVDGKPGKGTTDNDIGVFGGPQAGRLGPGVLSTINLADDIQDKIDNALPYDFIEFIEGSFSLNNINLRKGLILFGAGLRSQLTVNNAYGFQLQEDNEIRNLALIGDGTNKGLKGASTQGLLFKDLLMINFNDAINLDFCTANIQNITCSDNTAAIHITNSKSYIHIENSIFTSSSLYGLYVEDNAKVFSDYNLFYANSTDINGSVTQDHSIVGILPLFISPNLFFYQLDPLSNAINAGNPANIDVGCCEFYCEIGRLDLPLLANKTSRSYKSIELKLFGDSGTIPYLNPGISMVEIAYLLNSSSPVTLSDTIIITNNTAQTLTWNLTPRAIGKRFKLRIGLKSFQFSGTPYINQAKLSW